MPTPIGHTLAGLTIGEAIGDVPSGGRRWLWLAALAVAANLPDADYIPGFVIGRPNAFHHYALHSIGAALLFGFIIGGLLWRIRGKFIRYFICFSSVYMSHMILDFFAADSSWPYGMQILWPVSSEFFVSPLAVFLDVQKGQVSNGFVTSLLVWHNIYAVVWEIGVLVPFWILVRSYGRRRLTGFDTEIRRVAS